MSKCYISPITQQKLEQYNSRIKNFKPIYPGRDFEPYPFTLDRSKMTFIERAAYESFNGQKAKCHNPNNAFYSHYGGKGIEVRYSAREYIGWYLHSLVGFVGKKPVCARIDHDKDYCWENIFLCPSSENSRESMVRNMGKHIPQQMLRVVAYDATSLKRVATFDSIRAAARELGVSQRLIQFNVRRQYTKLHERNWLLRYEGENINDDNSAGADLQKRRKKLTAIT